MISFVSFEQAVEFINNCVAIRVNSSLLTYPADLNNGDDSFYFDSDQGNYDESDRTEILQEDNQKVYYHHQNGSFIFKDSDGDDVLIQGLSVDLTFDPTKE